MMATSRPFAYNTGSTVSATTQIGDLAIGTNILPVSEGYGGLDWKNGPDEDLGYVIGYPQSGGTQPLPVSGTGYVQFWRSKIPGDDASFINLAEFISRKYSTAQVFANGTDAKTWLNSNGFWTSYDSLPTPTATEVLVTPTPTQLSRTPFSVVFAPSYGVACASSSATTIYGTNATWSSNTQFYNNPTGPVTTNMAFFYNYLGEVIELNSSGAYVSGVLLCPTPNPTETPTATPTPTEVLATPTPSITSSNTPTPSVTPEPVTGYSFNLVALPYNFPTSGNSIMNNAGGITTGSTEINVLGTGGRGFYFNSIDADGIDRTNYYSAFTGQNVTITFSQSGNTAIYSGDTNSFKHWISSPNTGFVFGANIGVPPTNTPSGAAVLIQSASTQYIIGLRVYVSLVINNVTTPTPTPTATPTPTPTETLILSTPTATSGFTSTPTATEILATPTPTPTETLILSTPTATSGFTSTPTATEILATPTPTETPSNTPSVTPTLTPTNPTLLQILNQTTGLRTVTSCTLDGVSQTLTSGSFPITAGNNGYALTHGPSVNPNQIQFNFGGSGNFDLYSYKNGNLVNYLSNYNNSTYVAGGITLTTSDQLVLIITDPGFYVTPTPTSTSLPPTPTPTPSITSTATTVEILINNSLSLDIPITGMQINGVPVTYTGGSNFTINAGNNGNFTSNQFGSQTVTIQYGAHIPGQNITFVDSASNSICINLNGSPGTFTIPGATIVAGTTIYVTGADGPC